VTSQVEFGLILCGCSPTNTCFADAFVVDPKTGMIYTRRPLDRETLSHYTLQVLAVQKDGQSSDVAVVFIRVVDVNDHAPEVTYPLPGNEVHFRHRSMRPGGVSSVVVIGGATPKFFGGSNLQTTLYCTKYDAID